MAFVPENLGVSETGLPLLRATTRASTGAAQVGHDDGWWRRKVCGLSLRRAGGAQL